MNRVATRASIKAKRCFQLSLIVHIGAEIIAESVPRKVKLKRSSKNYCRIVSKNFEEILEKDRGYCNEILQTARILVLWKNCVECFVQLVN